MARSTLRKRAMSEKLSTRQLMIATWGVFGVLLLLGQAITRLGSRALEVSVLELTPTQLGAFAGWIVFSVYGEGYRAFQLRFSPRVVVRAFALAKSRNVVHVALAPAYCMSLFHATKRGRIVAWATVTLVVLLVIVVSRLPYPWRGIIDGGVALALIWGALAILFFYLRAVFAGELPNVDPALPNDTGTSGLTPQGGGHEDSVQRSGVADDRVSDSRVGPAVGQP